MYYRLIICRHGVINEQSGAPHTTCKPNLSSVTGRNDIWDLRESIFVKWILIKACTFAISPQLKVIPRYGWLVRCLSDVWWCISSLLSHISTFIPIQITYIGSVVDLKASKTLISRHAWVVRLESNMWCTS